MQTPIQISFEHIEHSGAIEHRVREELDKLEQFCGRLTAARVVVGREQRRRNKGDCYSVRLVLSVPGAEDIAITRDPAETGRHEDIHVAISDAFAAARRQLQDLVRKRQRRPKADEADPGRN
jgi:ribosome-associated translation inhibitor RaiA